MHLAVRYYILDDGFDLPLTSYRPQLVEPYTGRPASLDIQQGWVPVVSDGHLPQEYGALACNRALSGQDAKSGQFAYYVCQSIMKRGKNACVTPRLNARRFEQMIVDKIRSNILTEGSITELVKAVDEEMDGIASEQRKRLETIDTELEEVKRRLGRIWNAIETSDIDISDASDRIKEHRERKERLKMRRRTPGQSSPSAGRTWTT